jgi:iron-sulfur cluster assembly protein
VTRKRPQPLSITDNAVKKIQELIDSSSDSSIIGIRIGVKQGGCSGLKYYIEYAAQREKFEEAIETKGITVFIEAKALIYLLGSTMDYIDEKIKTGFIFTNPNSKGECGCGESFHI